jgi:hypothetical protein
MICSKVLTLGKADLIARFAQQSWNPLYSENIEYFNLGHPIGNPPRLRGSMVALLSSDFIQHNRDFVISGSPVDTGGIRFGFFNICDDPERIIDESKCDGDKFLALIHALSKSASTQALQQLYRHQLSTEVLEILKGFFSSRVISVIECNHSNPHSLLFEFSLAAQYRLSEEHIQRLFIPNTIDSCSTFPYLHSVASHKIVPFNPKYGIEYVIGSH